MLREIREYYDTGELKSISFKDEYDKYQGVYKRYSSSGTIKSFIDYKDGVIHGVCSGYSSAGTIESRWTYKDGEACGLFEDFNEDGQLHSTGFMYNGNLQGEHRIYHTDGSIKMWVFYLEGKMIPGKEYRENLDTLTPEEEFTLSLVFGDNYFRAHK